MFKCTIYQLDIYITYKDNNTQFIILNPQNISKFRFNLISFLSLIEMSSFICVNLVYVNIHICIYTSSKILRFFCIQSIDI